MNSIQPRAPITHELKTWPDVFQPVLDGDKPWEYRKADRNYQAGDALLLREWEPGDMTGLAPLGYTGREITVTVRYILCGPAYGIPEGYCIMSIKPLEQPLIADAAVVPVETLLALHSLLISKQADEESNSGAYARHRDRKMAKYCSGIAFGYLQARTWLANLLPPQARPAPQERRPARA